MQELLQGGGGGGIYIALHVDNAWYSLSHSHVDNAWYSLSLTDLFTQTLIIEPC